MGTGCRGCRTLCGGRPHHGLGLAAGARGNSAEHRGSGHRHENASSKSHTHTRDTGIGPTPAFVRAGFGNRVLKGPSANACMHRPIAIGPLMTSDREIGGSSSAISASSLARARGPHIGRAAPPPVRVAPEQASTQLGTHLGPETSLSEHWSDAGKGSGGDGELLCRTAGARQCAHVCGVKPCSKGRLCHGSAEARRRCQALGRVSCYHRGG